MEPAKFFVFFDTLAGDIKLQNCVEIAHWDGEI